MKCIFYTQQKFYKRYKDVYFTLKSYKPQKTMLKNGQVLGLKIAY